MNTTIKAIFTIFFILLFNRININAQNYHFNNYSVKDGLAQSQVNSVIQDKNGYLWIGTDAGVSSFDGIKFINYTSKNGLALNAVRIIKEFSNGMLWFGHNDGGISRLNNNKFEKIVIDSIEADITDIFEDKYGKIWIGTLNYGVFLISNPKEPNINKLKIKHFEAGKNGLGNYVFQIMQTSKGTLYFVSDTLRTFNYKTQKFNKFTYKNLSYYFQITTMYEDSKKNLWFGTYNGGLYTIKENEQVITYKAKDGLAGNWITTITEDDNNRIWIGTWGSGISVLENNKFKTFNLTNGLNDLKIKSITKDVEGNILIGTNEHGLNIFKGEQFVTFNQEHGILGKNIWAILQDSENNYWFGTNKGISIIKNNNFTKEKTIYHNVENNRIESNQIRYIKEDNNKNIWIGTGDMGVFLYNKKTKKYEHNFLINSYLRQAGIVTAMEIDKSNNLWIGSTNGLISYAINTDEVVRKTKINGLSGNDISALFYDSNNKLWIGALSKGITISVENDNSFSIIDSNYTFSPTAICEDSNGKVWVGTKANGIYVFDNYKLEKQYKMQDGLLADFITSIKYDNNNIYIGTSRGLNQYSLKSKKFYKYTEKTGFTGIEVKKHAICIDNNKDLWFGTVRGAVKLNKNAENINTKEPITHIKKIRVNLIERQLTNNLLLNHEENSIIFDYISICFSNPNAVSYKIMLEGADKDWLPETKQTFVNYSGLASGKYTFKVIAKNNNGFWNKKPQTFSFTIKPPFWKSVWFYIIATIAITILIFVYIKLREKKLIIENVKLEQKVKERTTEIRKKKDELEIKNKSITDSIHYAKRIQNAMLPTDLYINKILKEYFILFRPRNIVSGDYYWISKKGNKIIVAAVDCTGHGVPGAFMSMLGITLLDEIVNKKNITNSNKILNEMRASVIKSLKQQGKKGEAQDGMDIALCSINTDTLKMEFSGAYNPLYIVRNNQLRIFRANRMPIGIYYKKTEPFESTEIQLQKNDAIYMFSDGYVDQFNGETGEKMMNKRFKKYLIEINNMPMNEQKEMLYKKLRKWQGNTPQVDDILIIGFKINDDI